MGPRADARLSVAGRLDAGLDVAGSSHCAVLVSGSVPMGYAAHLTHLLDKAPVPLVAMAVEEAAASECVAPTVAWRNVSKLAKSLAMHRQGLWA